MNNREHIIIHSSIENADAELEKYQNDGYSLHGMLLNIGNEIVFTVKKKEVKTEQTKWKGKKGKKSEVMNWGL